MPEKNTPVLSKKGKGLLLIAAGVVMLAAATSACFVSFQSPSADQPSNDEGSSSRAIASSDASVSAGTAGNVPDNSGEISGGAASISGGIAGPISL